MRGSLVVLALVASPFLAASAQGHSPKRTDYPKCDARARGNSANVASQNGLKNRADPTLQGNKNCPPVTPPGSNDGGSSSGGSSSGSAGAPVGFNSVTGTLYNDPDGVGMYDGSQFGLAGWTVQLTGPYGVLSATTDGNGMFSFSGLPGGSYSLCVVPPGGWLATGPLAGISCPGASFGYSIAAPDVTFDVVFSDYDFGFKSAP